MLPIQEALNRVTAMLDRPDDFQQKRQEIDEHLDTIIEYARDSDERRAAVEFKVMVLNHLCSIGRELPEGIEAHRVDALKSLERLQLAIDERSAG